MRTSNPRRGVHRTPVRLALALALLLAARPAEAQATAAPVGYRHEGVEAATLAVRFTPEQIGVLEKLNRRDVEHLIRLTEMIVPTAWRADELEYAPLPRVWSWAATQAKVIVVHQPAQVFGAYASGQLVRWGPVSSGRKETPTPQGVFNLTWKAKSRRSTDNEQWLLNWYFNFVNARGISFHEFELPGRPASHACVRLLARDAEWLYWWGDQWRLSATGREVLVPGTPVVILGEADFGDPVPWHSLEWWLKFVDLPAVPTR